MSQSQFALAANIFTAPSAAFAAIRERPSAWFPIVLLVVLYGVTIFAYLTSVDIPWMLDRQMQGFGGDVTDEQRAAMVEQQSSISPVVLASISTVSSCIGFVIVFALIALYYTGASLKTGVKFKQWFALTAWCVLPVTLGLLASVVNVFAGDARFMPQEALNPLSFGSLFGIDGEGASMLERLVLQLDATTIWATVLMIFGYHAWTARSLPVSTAIVLGPTVVIFLLIWLASS